MKGNIKNLFALGSFTDTSYSHVSFMETSIRASIIYLNKYEKNMIGFHTEDNNFPKLIILIIIYIIIVYAIIKLFLFFVFLILLYCLYYNKIIGGKKKIL